MSLTNGGKGRLDQIDEVIIGFVEDICRFIGSEPDERSKSALRYSIFTGLAVFTTLISVVENLEFNILQWIIPLPFFLYFLFYGVLITNTHLQRVFKSKSEQLWGDVEIGKLDNLKYADKRKIYTKELKKIIRKLERKTKEYPYSQFTPFRQKKILSNKYIYQDAESSNYIKKQIIEKDYFDPGAIVCFLYQNRKQGLNVNFLNDLNIKYRQHESVRFTLGRFYDVFNIDRKSVV